MNEVCSYMENHGHEITKYKLPSGLNDILLNDSSESVKAGFKTFGPENVILKELIKYPSYPSDNST